MCGGTLFEAVYARGKLEEFKSWLAEYRLSHVEISDGTIDIPRERKLHRYAAAHPPSVTRPVPVMNAASSDTR